jgi:predicted regulator of Ras-like GTPase activity (Roadblock/LC7/MglB family)
MNASRALADLMEISSQVQAAVLLGGGGEPAASTLGDEGEARELGRVARELLSAAEQAGGAGREPLSQLEVATREGSVFVVRDDERAIAAVTGPSPTVGLVFYDLKTCLRAAAGSEAAEPATESPAGDGDGAEA